MNNKPIGVFDSGLGGISVLKELYALMPNENYIYYGDCLNAPYGTKENDEIMHLTSKCIRHLIDMDSKAVVIACNTATSVAANKLRREYDIPIIGIEPAVKPAAIAHRGGKIIVMATPMTLKKEKFINLTDNYSDMAEIISLPCPGLVEIIEKGITEGEEIDNYLKNIFLPYDGIRVDAVVLGCTHYPHIRSSIKKAIGYEIDIIDGGEGTARETKRRLTEENLMSDHIGKGKIDFISSKQSDTNTNLMKKLFRL